MVLWMIGLGLGDEGDISVKGLKAVQRMLGCRFSRFQKQFSFFFRDEASSVAQLEFLYNMDY